MHLFLRETPVCYMYFPKCSCNTKNQIDKNINKRTYVKLRLNKCYIQYLKDLYYDYYGEESSIYIKEIINHLQFFHKKLSLHGFVQVH